jgi:hypothetical protein
MPIIPVLLLGYLGGIALPQDPVPVKTVNPDYDPPSGPPKVIPPWPWCPVCRGIEGAIVAVIVVQGLGGALALTGFYDTAITAFAAGAVGSSLIGGLWSAVRKK